MGGRHCLPQFKVPSCQQTCTQCLTHSEWRLQYSEKAPTCEVGHLIFNGCCLTLQEMCQNNWSPSSLTILRIFGDQQNTHRVVQVSFSGECKKFECRNIQHDLHVWFLVSHLSRCSDPAQCIATTKLSWQLIVRSATSPLCPLPIIIPPRGHGGYNVKQIPTISIKSYFGLRLC